LVQTRVIIIKPPDREAGAKKAIIVKPPDREAGTINRFFQYPRIFDRGGWYK
jgi:hypothetical protein